MLIQDNNYFLNVKTINAVHLMIYVYDNLILELTGNSLNFVFILGCNLYIVGRKVRLLVCKDGFRAVDRKLKDELMAIFVPVRIYTWVYQKVDAVDILS